MTNLFAKMKNEVEKIIYQPPIDIYSEEDDIVLCNSEFELVNARVVTIPDLDYESSKIGLFNLAVAKELVKQYCIKYFSTEIANKHSLFIWDSILNELQSEKIIRQDPEFIRNNVIKLVSDNSD